MAAWLTDAGVHLAALDDLLRVAPDANDPDAIRALRDALSGSDVGAALLLIGTLRPVERRAFVDLVVELATRPRHLERARMLLRGAEAGVVAAEIATQAEAALAAADDWNLRRLIEVADQLALDVLPAILAAAGVHDSPEIRDCATGWGTEASLRSSLGLPSRTGKDAPNGHVGT